MSTELDCRGLACPAPVLQTKQRIEKENLSEINVIIDNQAAKENVSRFLENQKFEVSVEKKGTDFHVHGKKTGTSERDSQPLVKEPKSHEKKIIVMVGTERVAQGRG